MKKLVGFTIFDKNNEKYARMFISSLRKFHSEEDLPLVLVTEESIKATKDPMFFYRATPMIAKDLIKEYETVIKFDCDQIVCGDISHIWKEDFDVGVVNNSNPREMKNLLVRVWDIHPLSYLNCGLVVMKSEEFINHWWGLCVSPHFDQYQYREQDLLNIMVFYGNYKVKFLDAGKEWWGLISKGYWPLCERRENDIVLPKNKEWPTDEDKILKVIHWAGGNDPNKMKFRLHFKPEVVKRLEWLTK